MLDREFPSRSLRKSEESRARIAVDQEIEATSSMRDLINPESTTGKDFSDSEELDLLTVTELKSCYDIAYFIYEITERRAVTRQKGRITPTPSGRLKNVFSGRQVCLVREETLVVSTHACHRRPWGQRGMKWRDARNSHLEQAYSSVPKVKTQTDVKSLNSLKASLATKVQKSLFILGKMKKIVMKFSTSSRMSWLQVWKQMHLWPSLPISMCWWLEKTQREVEKKVLKDQLLFWKKKGPGLCISKFRSKEVYSAESWRIGIERFGGTHQKILRMHLVRNWMREREGQSGGIIQKGELHKWNPCALVLWGTTTWQNLTTSRLYQQSSVEFGEKICQLKAAYNYVWFSCEGARDS